jgi:8-oxo-dGTP pyrophosphatase MutT (NUDIX family)
MEREFSAGGAVVSFQDGRWRLAVIEPRPAEQKRARRQKPALALPKGLVNRGERPEEAAVREVREETGIETELITKLADIRYVYMRSWGDGQRVFKVVSFYLLIYRSGAIGEIEPAMRIEVRNAKWIPLEEARRQLTHRGEQEVAQLALEYIDSHPGLNSSKLRDSPR